MDRKNRLFAALLTTLVIFQLAGCANQRIKPNRLPNGVNLYKSVTVPVQVPLAIYVPESKLKSTFYSQYVEGRIEPGPALRDSLMLATGEYFTDAELVDLSSDRQFGLLLDLDPEWDLDGGKLIMKLGYRLLDAQLNLLREGTSEYKVGFNHYDPTTSFYNAAMRSSQLMWVDILNKLKPTSEKYVSRSATSNIPPQLLANMDKPVSSGTAFVINDSGSLVTAAHVVDRCLLIKAQIGDQLVEGSVSASSQLLDLAVIATNTSTPKFLTFRPDQKITLGEKVSSVSYPLKGLLEASPNLTLGNISSQKALQGSLGQFQFSAPIQPGSSGGPIVSEKGEILGMVTSTLKVAALIKLGVVPQNINFGLNGKYIVKFLQKHRIEHNFTEGSKQLSGTEESLSSTVQLACYQ